MDEVESINLLRANLGGSSNKSSLKQELETAAIYQRIEKLRLGDRLAVRWDIGELPMRAILPRSSAQRNWTRVYKQCGYPIAGSGIG